MRLSALLWPFPFGVRLGWASARVPNPDVDHARGRVFLLRGNGVVFSRGYGYDLSCRSPKRRAKRVLPPTW
jgi:hypothetical protein